MMFLFYVIIGIGAFALFATLFPEADEALCHLIYKIIMGGEDF